MNRKPVFLVGLVMGVLLFNCVSFAAPRIDAVAIMKTLKKKAELGNAITDWERADLKDGTVRWMAQDGLVGFDLSHKYVTVFAMITKSQESVMNAVAAMIRVNEATMGEADGSYVNKTYVMDMVMKALEQEQKVEFKHYDLSMTANRDTSTIAYTIRPTNRNQGGKGGQSKGKDPKTEEIKACLCRANTETALNRFDWNFSKSIAGICWPKYGEKAVEEVRYGGWWKPSQCVK